MTEIIRKRLEQACHNNEPALAHLLKEGAPEKRPLFLTHYSTLDRQFYQPLASNIGEGISVYSISLDDVGKFRTVEGMAARLIDAIVAIEPTGPYRIAGWAYAAGLAFEVATQLIGMDRDVSFLGLLNPRYESYLPGALPRSHRLRDDAFLLAFLCEEVTIDKHRQMELETLAKSTFSSPSLTTVIQACRSKGLLPRYLTTHNDAEITAWLDRERSISRIMRRYCAQTLSVPVYLFTTWMDLTHERYREWERVVPDSFLQTVAVDCPEDSIIGESCADLLGRIVTKALNLTSQQIQIRPEQSYSPLVTLQHHRPGNNGVLFYFPGAGDGVTSLMDVIKNLNHSVSVHGLQPRGLDGTLVPHISVEAASLCYIGEISHASVGEPLHLLGHSFGGWVAFEIARLLEERGRAVESLTILDSNAPSNQFKCPIEFDRTDSIMEMIKGLELLLGRGLPLSRMDLEFRDESNQLKLLHYHLVNEGLMPERSKPQVLRGPLRTFSAALRAGYIPKSKYMGRLRLLIPDDSRSSGDLNRLRHVQLVEQWRIWAPRVDYAQAPGNHMTMLRTPNARALVSLFGIKNLLAL